MQTIGTYVEEALGQIRSVEVSGDGGRCGGEETVETENSGSGVVTGGDGEWEADKIRIIVKPGKFDRRGSDGIDLSGGADVRETL